MIPVRKIGHTTFETPDIDRLVEHCLEVIGLTLTARDGDRAILSTQVGEEAVILKTGTERRCTNLSLQIDSAFDLADAQKQLGKHGVKSDRRSDMTPQIPDAVAFDDPAGTTIELFSHAALAQTSKPPGGAAAFKLGHTAFSVASAQKMVDFYTEVLGFRVSDWLGDVFAFLRCGPDHHTVNFLNSEHRGLHHIAFEMKDIPHLLAACELLGQKDIKIIWGPGRHGIGHNVFVYHRDPDDHIIEFYTEMDQMKDETLGYFEPRPWHKDRPQRPKVWERIPGALTWGTPPTPDYVRTHFKNAAF
jgi:catechol 2,3-dioxygenase-like lactoylglutathione lyase family enzyme